jgi:hypothetical protein
VRALLVLVFFAFLAATDGGQAAAEAPSPVPTAWPFDPRVDRIAQDSTPQLNIAGDPRLPDLGAQRCAHGVGGRPWTPCPGR